MNTSKPTNPTTTGSQSSTHTPDGVLEQAKHAAETVVGQAKTQVGQKLDASKEEATGKLAGVASAIRETGKHLGGEKDALPNYANRAAEQVESLSSYVRSRNVGELLGDLESFARREPALFIGGSFALGVMAARFLKSSAQHEHGSSSQGGRAMASRSSFESSSSQRSTLPGTSSSAMGSRLNDTLPSSIASGSAGTTGGKGTSAGTSSGGGYRGGSYE